ncbi:hypothetical protein L2725_01205 [Shewanella corallii]|uniref:Uncharacterized protein n=1 Tax=Shewanella corallii TaxID=560080 RepID=A0ABT0N1V8_9GAMM|nr:hypothetical protein [Shewanella corallii]MCL2912411.1 hypothetical protein [Shewanella corallii]
MPKSTSAAGLTLAALLASPTALAAGFDIFLYPLSFDDGQWQLGQPKALTDRDGYDSQPAFTSDSKSLLLSSDRSGSYTDIYRINIKDGKVTQLTNTPDEGEFSPTPMANKAGIRYVVEQGVPHQSVWQQTEGQPRERAVNSMINSGYYSHHPEMGTLLWARYGYNLYFEPKGEQADERHFVADSVGRSLHPIPGQQAFSFVQKRHDGQQIVTRFEPKTGVLTPIASLTPGSEDTAWSPNGWLFHTSDAGLQTLHYQTDKPMAQQQWTLVAPLTPPAASYSAPNRLAVSPDNHWLAIVWQRK